MTELVSRLVEVVREFPDVVFGTALDLYVEFTVGNALCRVSKRTQGARELIHHYERNDSGCHCGYHNGARYHNKQHVGLPVELSSIGGSDKLHAIVEAAEYRTAAHTVHICIDEGSVVIVYRVCKNAADVSQRCVVLIVSGIHDVVISVNDKRLVGFKSIAGIRDILHHGEIYIHANDADIHAVAEQRNNIGYHVNSDIVVVIRRHPCGRAVVDRGVIPADM